MMNIARPPEFLTASNRHFFFFFSGDAVHFWVELKA
jgi:hypothetical protein